METIPPEVPLVSPMEDLHPELPMETMPPEVPMVSLRSLPVPIRQSHFDSFGVPSVVWIHQVQIWDFHHC